MTALPVGAMLLLAAEGGHDNVMLFRVVNFLLLAAGLGYLIKKNAGPFFAARSESITREIADARRQAAESEARARAVEERLSRLDQEIQTLRTTARREMAAEHARLEHQSEQAVRKVFAQAEQEMAALAKAARQELKAYAAELAVELAGKRLAGRITPETQRALTGSFVRNL